MPETPAEQPQQNAPAWLKVLVALHLLAITIWAMPNPLPEVMNKKREPVLTEHLLELNRTKLKQFQPVQTYLFVTGFWQYWDMFSPNPANTDIWMDAQVVYRDGTKKTYQYPRMFLLPIHLKFVKERYRKFYERANQESYAFFWPVVAQRIAHLNDDPNNPPVTVMLTRHWREVAPPGMTQKRDYSSYTYYVHAVDPLKLAKDRKGPS